ncbi:zinc phosphodiesterase ELAC protein 2 [Prunus yedoensis var. nudiflora]|uniref:ribonuclease Z n=1 Tax=Prunus yedoensis var. nudiflora TaxID=2094558 RepID=A0A314XYS2_PRUYE|nr:zinc phosphodiesterase ELAC protein 2 [Prunus yedoensis var. nudiflora]
MPMLMPQVTNLRLLFFSPFPHLSLSSLSLKPLKPRTLFTALASSYRRRHRPIPNQSPNPGARNKTTLRESRGRDKAMEETKETETAGFNKRRAEGNDKNDRPKKNLQRKVRTLNPINTLSYVQVLGTGMDTQDTSPSVLLFFDKQRFIFNAGEGLQRFCTEHKIKLSKIDHIFLSRVCSETAGGLPGLLLTLAGMGEEGMSVNVWGPSDLKYLIDAMRCFIPNAAMVHTRSFGPSVGGLMASQTKFTEPIVLVDDEVVKISAIVLQPIFSNGAQLLNELSITQNPTEKVSNDRVDVSKPFSPNGKNSPTGKPGDMSVIYVCELPEIKGKFDPEKAKALGLKPGSKYRELQLGNSVKSDFQNITVYPSDVMDPSIPGPIVFLVDCPMESHLQELLSMQCLSSYYADFSGTPENAKVVTCVIHLGPASLISSPNYQSWMKRFGSAQHILAGHERKNVEIPILRSSARIAAQLNYLCPQFFPAPGFWSLQHLDCLAPESTPSSEGSVSKVCESISAENLLKFTLRPYARLGLDRSVIPSQVASSEIIDELLSEIPEVVDAAQCVSQLWHQSTETKEEIRLTHDDKVIVEEPWFDENALPSCLENIRRDDLEIVLLGTGSSQPSKYRNVSSIHINLFSKGGLLLDCGEGTLGQLKRRYGVEGADNAVRGLRCIWISHIHADHHTGLARILTLRRDLLKGVPHEPLLVVGPRKLKFFLDAYQRLEDLDMQFLDCKHTTEASLHAFEGVTETNKDHSFLGSPTSFEDLRDKNTDRQVTQKVDSTLFAKGSRMQSYWKRPGSPVDNNVVFPILKSLQKVLEEAGLEALMSFPVIHCPQAFGVVLRASERLNSVGKVIPGWKIVYSGDTRPCPELTEASRGATVLIHEATFEDGMVDEAIARNHSTTKEAIEVGNSAGVFRIILTHFSQRYPKIPVFDDTHMHKTCIGFDMMSINIADLPVLPKVLPYLKLLFRNEMIIDESDEVVDAAASVAS